MNDPHLNDHQIFIILFAKSIFHHLNAKQNGFFYDLGPQYLSI